MVEATSSFQLDQLDNFPRVAWWVKPCSCSFLGIIVFNAMALGVCRYPHKIACLLQVLGKFASSARAG